MDQLDSQQISTLLRMLQGGGGGDQNAGIHTASGLPPVPSESGLFNLLGISGTNDPSMSGGMGRSSLGPGNQGGPSLAELNLGQAESAAGDTSGGVNLGALGSLIGGTVGQQNIGGQGFVAGNTTPGPGPSQGGYTAGQTAGTGVDPLALIQKLLGSVKSGIGLASPLQGQDLGTRGDTGGTSLSDQVRSGASASGTGIASPVLTADQTGNIAADPGTSASNLAAVGLTGSEISQILPQLQAAGVSPSDLQALGITGQEINTAYSGGTGAQIGQGTLGQSSGGLSGPSSSGGIPSPVNTLSGGGNTNTLGAISGGLQGGVGLLTLIQAMQGGNVPGGIAGGLEGIGGLAKLLQSSPGLADALGLGGLGAYGSGLGNTSLFGDIGAAAGGIGGALGIEHGIQGLIKGGSPVQSGLQLGGGALSAYNALSQLFPETFQSLTGPALQAAINAAPELAAQLGINAVGDVAGVVGGLGFGPGIVTLGSDVSEGLNLDKNERLISEALQAIPVVGTPIAMLTNAIEQAFNPRSNYGINKLAGQMGPAVIGNLEQTAGLLPKGFDLNQLPTSALEQLVPRYGNALAGYYSAEGAGMPGGHGGDATAVMHYLQGLRQTDPAAYAQSQQALGTDKTGMLQAMADLQKRGIGSDVIGGLMGPELNAIGNMYNSDTIGGPQTGYVDPRGLMAGGFNQYFQPTSYGELAGVYGGPTWLALNQMYGPALASVLSQYGIQGPKANFSSITPNPQFAIQNAATQYQGAPATPDQTASQYDPNYAPSREQIASQYGLGGGAP